MMLQSARPQLTVNAVVEATNQARLAAGLPALRISSALVDASMEKADDMAKSGYFAHTSPAGQEPWYWFNKNGYPYLLAGENLAINFSDPQKLLSAWLASPKHKANILNPDFREIGVSVKTFNNGGKKYTVVVELFGTPQAVSMR
jgi:uncharacterized protein YkwD